jgi:hypothetical protein
MNKIAQRNRIDLYREFVKLLQLSYCKLVRNSVSIAMPAPVPWPASRPQFTRVSGRQLSLGLSLDRSCSSFAGFSKSLRLCVDK